MPRRAITGLNERYATAAQETHPHRMKLLRNLGRPMQDMSLVF